MAALVSYVQRGDSLDYTPSSAVAAGDVVVVGDLLGVAVRDIPAGTLGSLLVEGVFDWPKATGGGSAITGGDTVYWDVSEQVATGTSSGNVKIGKAVPAGASDSDTTVRAKLFQA